MTDEQLVLTWLHNRGVDVEDAEAVIRLRDAFAADIENRRTGRFEPGNVILNIEATKRVSELDKAARALAVVAAMENGCNPHRDFDAIEPDEAYVCHIYDGGESVAEGYGPTPWDALAALAKEAK